MADMVPVGSRRPRRAAKPTPLKAILLKCLDCCGGEATAVRLCTIFRSPLWRVRMGRGQNNPRQTAANRAAI